MRPHGIIFFANFFFRIHDFWKIDLWGGWIQSRLYKSNLQGRLANCPYKSAICRGAFVEAARQTAPRNDQEPSLQMIRGVVPPHAPCSTAAATSPAITTALTKVVAPLPHLPCRPKDSCHEHLHCHPPPLPLSRGPPQRCSPVLRCPQDPAHLLKRRILVNLGLADMCGYTSHFRVKGYLITNEKDRQSYLRALFVLKICNGWTVCNVQLGGRKECAVAFESC